MPERIPTPSPALFVSIAALVAATGGTAVAAKTLITSSTQIRNGAVSGADVKDGSVFPRDLSVGTQRALKAKPGATAPVERTAFEVFRKEPVARTDAFKQITVATLKGLPAGSYALSAKATIAPDRTDDGLLSELRREGRTAFGHCVLDAPGGQPDDSTAAVASPFSTAAATLNLQTTRTFPAAVDVKLNCDAQVPFTVADVSIIATPVDRVSRATG